MINQRNKATEAAISEFTAAPTAVPLVAKAEPGHVQSTFALLLSCASSAFSSSCILAIAAAAAALRSEVAAASCWLNPRGAKYRQRSKAFAKDIHKMHGIYIDDHRCI